MRKEIEMATRAHEQARQLAAQLYTEIVFRDQTTDEDYIFVAVTPELEGCMAQGETLREARENLRQFRVNYIEHLLEHNLPVPSPAWIATSTEATAIEIMLYGPAFSEKAPDQADYSTEARKVFEAQLRVENDLIEHR
jgi:predicted RNase H-like HicB family nuclease